MNNLIKSIIISLLAIFISCESEDDLNCECYVVEKITFIEIDVITYVDNNGNTIVLEREIFEIESKNQCTSEIYISMFSALPEENGDDLPKIGECLF